MKIIENLSFLITLLCVMILLRRIHKNEKNYTQERALLNQEWLDIQKEKLRIEEQLQLTNALIEVKDSELEQIQKNKIKFN